MLAGIPLCRVEDGNRVATKVLHQTHAGDIGCTIPHINHVLEGYGTIIFGDIAIDLRRIEDRFDTLIDFEDKLGFVGIVNRHSRPIGDAIDIVEERAGVDFAELVRNLCALDNLRQTRRVDIVQDADTTLLTITIDTSEPLLHTSVEAHLAARLLKRLPTQRQPLRLGLLNHAGHVGQHHVGILLFGQRIGLGPELLVALAYRRNKIILLHVARRQRAVKIVDQRNRKTRILHSFSV